MDNSMQSLFEEQTAIAPSNDFGSYVGVPVGDDLIIGVSNSPGNDNGGLIARLAPGGDLSLETVVNEQGVHDIEIFDGEIFVTGTDPTDGGWDLGNVYRSVGGGWSQYRTLPNVIHALGATKLNGEYWVAAGAHVGDNTTYSGRLYRSTDLQSWTWQEIGAVINGTLYTYRVMDVANHGGTWYATAMWGINNTRLLTSQDGCVWTQTDLQPSVYARYIIHSGMLCMANQGGFEVYAFGEDGSQATIDLPESVRLSDRFNILASDGAYLYALDNAGYILRTSDLVAWQRYSYVANAISVGYWPSQNCLVVSDRGAQAKLWRIPV